MRPLGRKSCKSRMCFVPPTRGCRTSCHSSSRASPRRDRYAKRRKRKRRSKWKRNRRKTGETDPCSVCQWTGRRIDRRPRRLDAERGAEHRLPLTTTRVLMSEVLLLTCNATLCNAMLDTIVLLQLGHFSVGYNTRQPQFENKPIILELY